jgi:hypothetical protein
MANNPEKIEIVTMVPDPSPKPPPLTAEMILEQTRTRRIKEVPYLGGTVYAHGFKRVEAKLYRQACREAAGEDGEDGYSDERLVQHCIHDKKGQRIFTEAHLTRLADMNEADFAPLLVACLEVNGFRRVGEDAIRKNSGPTPTSASGSASPSTTDSAT